MRFSMMPLTTLSWLHQYYRSTLLGAVLTVGIARRIEEDVRLPRRRQATRRAMRDEEHRAVTELQPGFRLCGSC